MFSQIIATGLLALSVGAPTRQNANVNSTLVSGAYNFQSNFDFQYLLSNITPNTSFQVNFNAITYSSDDTFANWDEQCVWYLGNGENFRYVESIKCEFYTTGLQFYIYYYDDFNNLTRSSYAFVFNSSIDVLDDVSNTYRSSIFNFSKSFYLNGDSAILFNYLLTHDDNDYVSTYNGYYNFTPNISTFNNKVFAVFGSISFDNRLFYSMTDYEQNNTFRNLRLSFYDLNYDSFMDAGFSLPLSNNTGVTYNNVYMTNCKISNADYVKLDFFGDFAYVRDTSHDNDNFHDLLFGIMDSPIYFLSRLMSFELFGVNMFVAFTGLLTLCVVIVLIRKF